MKYCIKTEMKKYNGDNFSFEKISKDEKKKVSGRKVKPGLGLLPHYIAEIWKYDFGK